jgi:hypothetical protein
LPQLAISLRTIWNFIIPQLLTIDDDTPYAKARIVVGVIGEANLFNCKDCFFSASGARSLKWTRDARTYQ